MDPSSAFNQIVPLPRVATWQQWEDGRAARRALSTGIAAGNILRRKAGHPRKDALLRQLCGGERGHPFQKAETLKN
jgi:hypothetical protein